MRACVPCIYVQPVLIVFSLLLCYSVIGDEYFLFVWTTEELLYVHTINDKSDINIKINTVFGKSLYVINKKKYR